MNEHSTERSSGEGSKRPTLPFASFATACGFVVTGESGGRIPLNSRVLAKIENGGEEVMMEMQYRANAYPKLVEFVRARAGNASADALLRELGEIE